MNIITDHRATPGPFLLRGLAILIAGASFASAASACSVEEAVGRIDTIERAQESDVQIKRASGKQEVALKYHYLCPGDRILRSGSDTFVGIRWDGRSNLEYIDESNYEVGANSGSGIAALARDWMTRLGLITGSSRSRVPIETRARGVDDEGDDLSAARALKLTPFSHGFTSPQSISFNREVVAVVWTGSALNIRLSEYEGRFLSAASVLGQPWAVLRAPQDSENFVLEFTSADRTTQTLEISRSAEVPDGPSVSGLSPETANLIHALWLIGEAGPQWRLEGLSRLQELSSQSLAADHAWNRVIDPSLKEQKTEAEGQ